MNVNIVLFDDFEMMDAFGPAQLFGMRPDLFYVNYFSVRGGIVNSSSGLKVWTEYLIPREVEDILVIPGGKGAGKLLSLEPESLQIITQSAQAADRCLMVCGGSDIVGQTGLLYHRRIADYQGNANRPQMFTAGTNRVTDFRWVADGKFYSCADTVSGLDMSLSVIAEVTDPDVAEEIAKKLGYSWNSMDEEGVLY